VELDSPYLHCIHYVNYPDAAPTPGAMTRDGQAALQSVVESGDAFEGSHHLSVDCRRSGTRSAYGTLSVICCA